MFGVSKMSVLMFTASKIKYGLSKTSDNPDRNFVDLRNQTVPGQFGVNCCGTNDSQTSNCQTLFFNSVEDFCIWGPAEESQKISEAAGKLVAWCTRPGRGTRLIPDGALKGVHFISTNHYTQITGTLNGTLINIAFNDTGAELDPEGATGLGNPVGGLIFTESFGEGIRQVKDWTSFMGDGEFCMRICNPDDEESTDYCNQRYDMMGCKWVMPGVYTEGFDSCEADSLPPPGVYGSSTFKQGDTPVPPPHEPTLPTNCSYYSELKPIPANNLTSFQCVAPTKKNPKRNSSSVADYARSKSRAYRLRCNFFLQPALIILLMSLLC